MNYALWDTATNNMVAAFDNERDSLALVRRAMVRNGDRDVETLALDVEDEHGEVRLIAYDRALGEQAPRELADRRADGEHRSSRCCQPERTWYPDKQRGAP